ncbi:hypothetical protein ACWCV5_09860 [Streptomyces tubercidicus]
MNVAERRYRFTEAGQDNLGTFAVVVAAAAAATWLDHQPPEHPHDGLTNLVARRPV